MNEFNWANSLNFYRVRPAFWRVAVEAETKYYRDEVLHFFFRRNFRFWFVLEEADRTLI